MHYLKGLLINYSTKLAVMVYQFTR